VTEAPALAGAAASWLGIALLLVADGRRGLALGLVVATAGLVLATAAAGQPPAGVAALAAGGLIAAALRLRDGQPGWGLLPPGSTPRLTGAIVVLIAAVIVAGPGIGSAEGAVRLGALVVATLAAGRILTVDQRWAALGAASALAIGLGALGGLTAMVAGAAVAAGLGAIGGADPVEAEA
jgi:hypothetical protein